MCDNESVSRSEELFDVDLFINRSNGTIVPDVENYRIQLYQYAMAERVRMVQQLHSHHLSHRIHSQTNMGQPIESDLGVVSSYCLPMSMCTSGSTYARNLALSMASVHPPHHQNLEEPKPQQSYIGLIAMAILSSPERKLVLSDIYQHILEHYPYFRRRGPGWRNSIRHNLSLNDCFVKSGRSANGKGHYWAIHPANLNDFQRGDFRRRKAQRKVRRHMGLTVDEEPDSPSPPPVSASLPEKNTCEFSHMNHSRAEVWRPRELQHPHVTHLTHPRADSGTNRELIFAPTRKRQFDVASLLAPDEHQNDTLLICKSRTSRFYLSDDEPEHENDHDEEGTEVEIDVGAAPPKSSVNLKSEPNSSNGKNSNSLPSLDVGNQHCIPTYFPNYLYFKHYFSSPDQSKDT